MTKSLTHPADLEQVCRRIASLTPSSRPVWGRMSVGGMLCHLNDSYDVALGDRVVARVRLPLPLPRRAIRYFALSTPLPWAKNMKTAPEVQQDVGGTRPGLFGEDQARLLDTVARFRAHPALDQAAHPFFGQMLANEWLRWGYLHADHHLRQFSA